MPKIKNDIEERELIYHCPGNEINLNCKVIIKYKSIYTYRKAIQENRYCLSCRSKMSAEKGNETKRRTENWGIETKRKNGTLNHKQESKNQIKKTLKRKYMSGEIIVWNKGLTKKIDNRLNGKSRPGKENPNYEKGYYKWWVEKYGKDVADEMNKKLSIKKSLPGKLNGMYGKSQSLETINKILCNRNFTNKTFEKMRISAIKRIERTIGKKLKPSYNTLACKIIDKYSKKYGFNFQHAENGGERCIGGYFPDGIDEKRKTIIEVDEKHHFNGDGTLKKRDIERQQYLENLGYKVIRVKV